MSARGIPRGTPRQTAADNDPAPPRNATPSAGDGEQRHPAKSSTSRKRTVSGARDSYPRKRAATACQVCRLRKVHRQNFKPHYS